MCLQPGNEQVRRTVHGGKTNCKATHREQMDQGNVWGNRPMKEYESLMSYIPNQYIREWKTKLIKLYIICVNYFLLLAYQKDMPLMMFSEKQSTKQEPDTQLDGIW